MSSGRIKRFVHSLGFEIALLYAAALFVSIVLIGAFAAYTIRNAMVAVDRQTVTAEFQFAVDRYGHLGLAAFREQMDQGQPEEAGILVRIAESDGRTAAYLAARSDSPEEASVVEADLRSDRSVGWTTIPRRDRRGVWQVYTGELADGRRLQVAKDDAGTQEILRTAQQVMLGATGLGLALALIGGTGLTVRALQPIRELVSTAEKVVRSGDMTARVNVRSSGAELKQLSQLFNEMLARNERLIQNMRDALGNVAHDLRTPLSRLRSTAETALHGPPSERAHAEALTDCLEESDRVLSLLRGLMDISEAEGGAMKLNLEEVDLSRLVARVTDLYEYVAEDRGLSIQTELAPQVIVFADPTRLEQAIANLIDNAIKYGLPAQRVHVAVGQDLAGARVVVSDTGVGIADEDLPHIWDRLFRGDRSRSERGFGLGLSLVKAIVGAHRGDVRVESRVGSGSIFTIVLPRRPSATPPEASVGPA